jgi:hypothetical protein
MRLKKSFRHSRQIFKIIELNYFFDVFFTFIPKRRDGEKIRILAYFVCLVFYAVEGGFHSLIGLGCSIARFSIVSGGVGRPEGEVVAEQLHDKRRVLVAVLVQRVELGNGLVKCLWGTKEMFNLFNIHIYKSAYLLTLYC